MTQRWEAWMQGWDLMISHLSGSQGVTKETAFREICWFQTCTHPIPHFSSADEWALESWVYRLFSQGSHRARRRKGSKEASIFFILVSIGSLHFEESSVCSCCLSGVEQGRGVQPRIWVSGPPDSSVLLMLVLDHSQPCWALTFFLGICFPGTLLE